MPDTEYTRLYREAITRDCPVLWNFQAQRISIGAAPVLAMVRLAEAATQNGRTFLAAMDREGRRIAPELTGEPEPTCPICGQTWCDGAFRGPAGPVIIFVSPNPSETKS